MPVLFQRKRPFVLLLLICLLALPLAQVVLAEADVLDTRFGTGGVARLQFGGTDPTDASVDTIFNALVPLADGKTLVAGSFYDGDVGLASYTWEGFVARYCKNGLLDDGVNCGSPAFGTNGKTIIPINNPNFEVNRVVMLGLPGGKILVAGENAGVVWLARLNADGTFDTSFGGGDGFIPTLYTQAGVVVSDMIQLASGQILITGAAPDVSANNQIFMLKFDIDGTLDTTFGVGGMVTSVDFGRPAAYAYMTVEDSNQKLLLTGYTTDNSDGAAIVARFTSTGLLDNSYSAADGTPGFYIYDPSTVQDMFTSIALLPGDQIVAAGSKNASTSFDMVKLTSDGALDTTFNTTGIVSTVVTPGKVQIVREILVQPDNKIILGGTANDDLTVNPAVSDIAMVRYTSAGAVDTTFGTNGIVLTNLTDTTNGVSIAYDYFHRFKLLSTGQIMVAGYISDGLYNNIAYLARYGQSPYTISGNAGIAGATLSYTDGTLKTATSDVNGDYTLDVSLNWTGSVTPSKTNYTFSPASKPYTSVATDYSAENYTVTSCTGLGSGSVTWSDAFLGCPAGAKFIIPTGLNVTLDTDISIATDLEINSGGTLIPNGKTVTLTGSAAQTLTGSPLTFYNLVINKTAKANTVTVSGKLKVSKKLTITTGKLTSASDYGDVDIATEGILELTQPITVTGSWTFAGDFIPVTNSVTFAGATLQTIGGTKATPFYDLVFNPGSRVFIETLGTGEITANATNSVVNNGIISQTVTVNNSTVNFLKIGTNLYNGVDIDATDENLGSVSVAIEGNSTTCTSNPLSPPYRNRCFRVSVDTTPTVAATMTFYTTAAEDDIATNDDIYQDFFGTWAALTASCGAGAGASCTKAVDNLQAGVNNFLIGGGVPPNAVSLSSLTARPAGPFLLIGLLATGLLAVALAFKKR